MKTNKPPVFVFGRTINALAILRSIGRRGIRTYLVDSDPTEIGFFSRYCNNKLIIHDLRKEPQIVLEELVSAVQKLNVRPILICTRDEYLVFLSKYHKELKNYFLFNLPDPEIVDCIVDKRLLAQFAIRSNVPHPRTYTVNSFEQLLNLNHGLRYPVIIKPPTSHLAQIQKKWMGQKLLIAPDHDTLQKMYLEFENDHEAIMIQEQVQGAETDIYAYYSYYSEQSQPLGILTLKKLRQYPVHFGYGCAEQSIWIPKIAELGHRLFKEMKYKGIGGVEFKLDSQDGTFKLIEVDGRTPMNVGIAIASGVDLPWISYRDLIGEVLQPIDNFKTGVKWFFFEDDFAAYLDYRKRGELSFFNWLKSYRGKKAFGTFSLVDPRPFWVSFNRFLKSVLHSILKRFKRKKT